MNGVRLALFVIAFIFILPAEVAGANMSDKDLKIANDSLLRVLDQTINTAGKLRKQHDEEINSLRKAYFAATSWRSRYDISHQIYEQYCTYRTDSAIHYLQLCYSAARHLDDNEKITACQCQMVYHYSRSGFFGEAIFTLNDIDTARLSPQNRISYYTATAELYGQMEGTTKSAPDKVHFQEIRNRMLDSLLAVPPCSSQAWITCQMKRCIEAHRYDEALRFLCRLAKMIKPGTHDYAEMEFYFYLTYDGLKHPDEALYHLLLSTITDVSTVTYDEAAVFYLSRIMRERGDIKRAREYVRYAYDVSTIFGGKMKDWVTNDIESVNVTFLDRLLGHNRTMTIAIVILAILVLVVIILAVQLLIQHRKLHDAADSLKQSNAALSEANRQLKQLVEQNMEVNKRLAEANGIKEKCIGTFFALCTQYIEDLNNFSTKTDKLLRNRQFQQLADMIRSVNMQDAALQNLYRNFDTMFLTIYPDFVSKFNDLLEPEYRVTLTKEGTLNTQLRIFALIRLGITDSGRISTLLNLANSTVYNYRTSFRKHARGDRADFENRVRRII